MRLRLASLAFLLASVATGLAWLIIQPTLLRLTALIAKRGGHEQALLARIQAFLPYQLGLNILLVGALTYLVLQLLVGRPLDRTESLLEQLEHLNLDLPSSQDGGPLLARLQASLQRTAHSLREAQQVTAQQLEALTLSNSQLRHTQAELVASEQLATVGRLAAGVAHEVGNPLSGILGYLSLARSQSTHAELIDYLQRIEDEVQRINGIVRSLLELGRPSNATVGPVTLAPLVEACARLVQTGPDFGEVKVELKVPSDLTVMAEPGPLSQILINLLLNAAQAMKGKGTIAVTAGAGSGGEVELAVTDEGPGIAPEVLPRLFEPFFTTKAPGKGTGLGLAVSRQLAMNLGAQLGVRNRPEGGAMFFLTLLKVPGDTREGENSG